MRTMLAALAFLFAACGEPPPETLRLVTLEARGSAGLRLSELPAAALRAMGLSYGLAVLETGAAAAHAGLRVGDVVYAVNRKPIGSVEEFSRLAAQPRGGVIGLLVRRGKSDFYVAVELDGAPPRAPWGRPGLPPRDTLLRT